MTLILQNEITAITFKCYKQRKTLDITPPSWWTAEIKIARNRVRANRTPKPAKGRTKTSTTSRIQI